MKNTAAWASESAGDRVTSQQKAVKGPPAPSKKPMRQEAEAEQGPPAPPKQGFDTRPLSKSTSLIIQRGVD